MARAPLVDQFLKEAYYKDENENSYQLFKQLLSNDTVMNFYQSLNLQKEEIKKIKDAIVTSVEIYQANRLRGDAHKMRVYYMRSNFENYYNEATGGKYILKGGRLHMGKNRQLNAYDVGHKVQELAKKDHKYTLHIGFLRGYYQKENGEMVHYGEKTEEEGLFLNQFAHKELWTLIDLKKLSLERLKGEFHLPAHYSEQYLLSYLENYDYMLIPPVDKRQTPISE